jgi:transposase
VRLRAGEWFALDIPVREIAQRLRVSTNAVYVWRRRWRAGGPAALVSKGPGGSACRLDEQRQARLAQALEQGPAAHGFDEDQRWTLARVADLIERLFHIRYTLRGVSYLLHRMGFSPQVPAHRAVERDEEAIATWRREAWPAGNGSDGAGCVAVLRGRGRSDSACAESPYVGSAWAYPAGRGVGQGFRPGFGRRTGVCGLAGALG